MKLNGSGVWLLLGLAVGAAGGFYASTKFNCGTACGISGKPAALNQAMRKLWADHVIWTRQYIVAALQNSPDVAEAAKRLLKNQEDIGAAIAPFYGEEAGKKLTSLLKDHIIIATKVVDAAQHHNDIELKKEDALWHKNADDIALLLSQANPTNWPYEAMKEMLYEHLKLTAQEAVTRLGQQWDADVKNFDAIFDQAMHMADGLADGMAKQFPDKL